MLIKKKTHTHTHTDYEIYIAFPLQQLLHARVSMFHDTYVSILFMYDSVEL